MTSAVCSLIFASQMSLGCAFGGFHHDRPVTVAPATIVRPVPQPVVVTPAVLVECDACGVRFSVVDAEIYGMRHDPRWRKRDNAAHRLKKYDWHCHPQIVPALIATMLHDCHEEVREEAAESLAKMAPCLPEVHTAFLKSSQCDPDHATRKWARRGLDRVARHCEAPCSICGPVGSDVVVGPIGQPGPVILDGPPSVVVEPPLTVPPSTPLVPGAPLPSVEGPALEPLSPDDLTPAPLPPPSLVPPLPPADASPLAPLPEARRPSGRAASLNPDAKLQRVSSRDNNDDTDHRDPPPNRPRQRPFLSIFRIGR
jgi:hypothetical protein